MEENRPNQLRYRIGNYTREQKLVATVWYHERLYTGLSFDQLTFNFEVRFKNKCPNYSTLKYWEKRLFRGEFLVDHKASKPKTALRRLMYVPYVKDSFVKFPNLSRTSRAQLLGIPVGTLQTILKQDLTPNDVKLLKSKKEVEKASDSSPNNSKNVLNESDSKERSSEVKNLEENPDSTLHDIDFVDINNIVKIEK